MRSLPGWATPRKWCRTGNPPRPRSHPANWPRSSKAPGPSEIEWRIRRVRSQAGASPLSASGEDAARCPGCEVSLRILQSSDAAASVVYVEAAVAKESDQRHPTTFGGCGCKAGGGADSGQQRNAGHRSLLHQLKTGASTDEHHRIGKRSAEPQKGMADQLVYCVVPPDVPAH